ncbi:MAG TPA: response regulator [Candidatus Limnocylindrales bacterium]|nr:response regulator [Candidatus Limnocylindrales bacterium]
MPSILVTDDDAMTRQMVRGVLKKAGHSVATAADGMAALRAIQKQKFELVLLDIWMPKMTGLGLLGQLHGEKYIPKIVIMTSDQTSDTLLNALRGRVYQYLKKPLDATSLLATVENALSTSPEVPAIEVVSANSHWVELMVPCERSVVSRVQSFLMHMDVDLPPDVIEKVGYAFRELLNNAIEWGGHLDPNLKVRVSYIRTKKMLMYRLDDPGPGFKLEELKHAAINNPQDNPMAHMQEREARGLRPGGLGLMLTQQLVDELVFNERRNGVVLIKYL